MNNRWLLVMVGLCAALAVIGALLAWLVARREGWDEGQALALGAATGGGVGALFGQPAFGQWLAEKRAGRQRLLVDRSELEAWQRVLRGAILDRRVRENSQLAQMLHRVPTIDAHAIDVASQLGDDGRSRVRVRGESRPWSAITSEWNANPTSMLILGEPGYGKTVAALTLLRHVNGEGSERIAELFPLAEWYAYSQRHPGGHLRDWMSSALAIAYQLPPAVASAIADADDFVPILDGLDEVPEDHRTACKQAIDAHAESALPYRPFVVTCRASEYMELAPTWFAPERQLFLTGLDRDQVGAILAATTATRPAWKPIRERIAAGDPQLSKLFRSPLRLGIALQAYEGSDPAELAQWPADELQPRIWDLFIQERDAGFEGADAATSRKWLGFLASGMTREARQRLWLHELQVLAPPHIRSPYVFKAGVAAGVCGVSLAADAIVAALSGSTPPLTALIGAGFWGVLVGIGARPEPYVRSVSWRTRLLGVREGLLSTTVFALIAIAGLTAFAASYGVVGEALPGICAIGASVFLGCAFVDFFRAGSTAVIGEPPREFAGADAGVVLNACRNSGVAGGLGVWLLVFPALVAAATLGFGSDLSEALPTVFYHTVPLLVGGAFLVGDLGPWLYHQWLKRRLAHRGFIPARLREFLDWCAMPERGWLRVSDAYEFRHRELLNHLAAQFDDLPAQATVVRR